MDGSSQAKLEIDDSEKSSANLKLSPSCKNLMPAADMTEVIKKELVYRVMNLICRTRWWTT